MFDSRANRLIYDDAKSRHEELMDAETDEGQAYRLGYWGKSMSENPLLPYEFWRAGRDNAGRGTYDTKEGR